MRENFPFSSYQTSMSVQRIFVKSDEPLDTDTFYESYLIAQDVIMRILTLQKFSTTIIQSSIHIARDIE